MTSETMFAPSPFVGFKWEIECTDPKNSNKSDVRCKKISHLARKVLEAPTSVEIYFSTIKIGLHCSFHPEKTSLYHSLLGEIYSTRTDDQTLQLNTD